MVLSRCSSSAVQGVLVRPFFLGVPSAAVSPVAPVDAGAAIVDAEPDCEARRFRGFEGGVCVGGIGMPSKEGTL